MGEFVRGKLAEQYHPCVVKLCRCGRVPVRNVILHDLRVTRSQNSLCLVYIFQSEGDAMQRAFMVTCGDLSFGNLCLIACQI